MSEYVSFLTAQKLKLAGFPQPDYKPGQVWYQDGYQVKKFIVLFTEEGLNGETWPTLNDITDKPHEQMYAVHPNFSDHVPVYFAATAIDILKELPDGFAIKKINNQFSDGCKFEVWSSGMMIDTEYLSGDVLGIDELSADEASANAYLHLHPIYKSGLHWVLF